MGNLEQAAEKKPLIVLTGTDGSQGKTALSHSAWPGGRRRDHQRGFDAGVPPQDIGTAKIRLGGDGRCARTI